MDGKDPAAAAGHSCNQVPNDGIHERDFKFVELFKSFGLQSDLQSGSRLHAHIILNTSGLLERSPYVASALISMYMKCGAVAKARQVFDELPVQHLASWNALLAGYVKQGQCHHALNCFQRIQDESLAPDKVTFICILKACGGIGAIDKGKQIHNEIANRGLLKKNIVIGNALVDMYAKCHVLTGAQQVLEQLPVRNVVTWSTLISGYAKEGEGHKALHCFNRMQSEGLSPDGITFSCILKACGNIRDLQKGELIHDDITNRGLLGKDIVLTTSLVDMYAKCGALKKAQLVLEGLSVRNPVTWSALISGYAQQGKFHEALDCFQRMQVEGITPNEITFTCVLKACGNTGAIDKGKQIHEDIVNRGLLKNSIVLGTALVDMYAKCGVLAKAQKVLDDLPSRDIVSWSALIAGYVQEGRGHDALNCFGQMQREGLCPNEVTFICILKACGSIGSVDKGKQIHEEIQRRGLLEKSIELGNALVDMYAKCGMLTKALQVLEELPVRNVVSWNALIAGCVQHEQGHEALNCYERMQREGIFGDEVTFTCILKTCGNTGTPDIGKQIHEEVMHRGFLKKNIVLGTAVVDMYAKCGMLAKAAHVLEGLPARDTVSWNALIAGYTHEGQGHEALNCFSLMRREGLSPNEVTFTCILSACSCIATIDKGTQIHNEIVNAGLLATNIALGNALVDLYAKCGVLTRAHQVLKELPLRDVVSWSALIAGYAQKGQDSEAMSCFKQMQKEGLAPNELTFLSLLNAFSHSGKLDEAEKYYENMSIEYGIIPELEHHACMVGLFGCAGRFDKAMSVIQTIPSCRNPSVWLLLLGYCRKWGNLKLGRLAFDSAIRLDDTVAAAYVLMSNIYSTAGMQDDAQIVEEAMKARNADLKKTGMSMETDAKHMLSKYPHMACNDGNCP